MQIQAAIAKRPGADFEIEPLALSAPRHDEILVRITSRGHPWLRFAGPWDRAVIADVGEVQSFTILTQPAGSPLTMAADLRVQR
jgi:hypothetical protein